MNVADNLSLDNQSTFSGHSNTTPGQPTDMGTDTAGAMRTVTLNSDFDTNEEQNETPGNLDSTGLYQQNMVMMVSQYTDIKSRVSESIVSNGRHSKPLRWSAVIKNKINIQTTNNNTNGEDTKMDISTPTDIKTDKWYTWDCNDIVSWIISLDNGKYSKYRNNLLNNLRKNDYDGNSFHELKNDGLGIIKLKDMGITLDDSIEIIKHIKTLPDPEGI